MTDAKKKPAKKRKTKKKPKKKKVKTKPSVLGSSGKDPKSGKFLPGNKCGRGNPHAGQAQKLRAAWYDAVTPQDMRDICKALIKKAKKGDVHAAKEVLFRVLGQYPEVVIPNEPDQEDWIYRTTLSDGSYLVVPAGTDPIAAYHATLRSKEPEKSD